MSRVIAALVLVGTLAAGAPAADPPKKLTQEERRELETAGRELVQAGMRSYKSGKLEEATTSFEKAVAVARRLYPPAEFPDGHEGTAALLNQLGLILRARGKYADAEPVFREVLEMNRRLYPKRDHPNTAEALNNLALVLHDRGKYADAEPLYRDAVVMYRRLHPREDDSDLAAAMNNLAVLLRDVANYTDAEKLCRDAMAMRGRLFAGRAHPALGESLNTLGRVLQDQGNYADAETMYRQALELRLRLYPRQDHLSVARSLNNLALLLRDRGKHAEAEPLCRASLEMHRRLYDGQDHPVLATSLGNMAGVLQDREKFADAEPYAREALEMTRRLYGRQDHPDLVRSLSLLAGVLDDLGRFAEAGRLSRESLEMCRRVYSDKDHPDLARTLNHQAVMLGYRGKFAEAAPLCREAVEMYRRLYPGQDRRELALSLANQAYALQVVGKHADADAAYREALRIYRARAEEYAAMQAEGDALTLAASYPLARDGFLSHARQTRPDPAAVYAEVWSSKAILARVYERRAMAARAAAADPKAAALLTRLTDRRRRRADLLLAPVPPDPATLKRRAADLAQLSRDITDLERELRPLLPAVGRADRLAKATPDDLRKALPADAAVVDFIRYTLFEEDPKNPGKAGEKLTPSYMAFVVTRDRVAQVDVGPARPIEQAVAAWREAVTGGKDVPPELAARVRDLAWAKVRKEVPIGVKAVYVAPDLALCRVPWAALPGDKDGTILLEDYAVAAVPHAPFLLDRLWPQDAPRERANEVLVVGGVAYDAEPPAAGQLALNRGGLPLRPGRKVAWSDLPGTAAEAKGVAGAAAKKHIDARQLGADSATPAAVLAALPKAKYAHLATHGFFADAEFRSAFQVDPRLFATSRRGERVGAAALSPLVMTGLVFAGANQPKAPGRGIMTGEALVDVDLSGLELAVLSACETGLGDVAGGEGTFGLQRAFHLAGARDVVASLWKVPDRPTAALMALFYGNLWEKGLPPVEALRQAQLEVYRHADKIADLAEGFRGKFEEVPGSAEPAAKPGADGKAHPRLWAAFTLSGPGR
jgi:CHAT domain-containing protein/tetratricopeptide (TPR) repeat protein